jgi:hypothetical protein
MPLDAAEIATAVRKEAVRHEMLAGRLSRVIGAIPDYHEKTLEQLALYGLEKLGIEPPTDGDDPATMALEYFLRGRANTGGGAGGMDSADSHVDRYINSSSEDV